MPGCIAISLILLGDFRLPFDHRATTPTHQSQQTYGLQANSITVSGIRHFKRIGQSLPDCSRLRKLVRMTRSVYAMPETQLNERLSLIVVANVVPRARICLLYTLRFHEHTTQNPQEVWIAIGVKVGNSMLRPRLRSRGLRNTRSRGFPSRSTLSAKAVVELFRYRRKIAIDGALEAPGERGSARRFSISVLAWSWSPSGTLSWRPTTYLSAVSLT